MSGVSKRFPLPPGYAVLKQRKVWVCYAAGRRVCHAFDDTRSFRILIWEYFVGWHGS